jgi:hypothetical protein
VAGLQYPVSQLEGARVVLNQRWQQTKSVWNDKVQREFEQEFIVPLEQQLPRTRETMERLSQVIVTARGMVS